MMDTAKNSFVTIAMSLVCASSLLPLLASNQPFAVPRFVVGLLALGVINWSAFRLYHSALTSPGASDPS
jgi:hypothetical protein